MVLILNSMVSASPTMMMLLRRLRALLHGPGLTIEAQLPSPVSRFADVLSRTLDPGDIPASGALLRAIYRQYHFDSPTFLLSPMNEALTVRFKVIRDHLDDSWNNGTSGFGMILSISCSLSSGILKKSIGGVCCSSLSGQRSLCSLDCGRWWTRSSC